jgi:8-oxo-dGTP diphosphatase
MRNTTLCYIQNDRGQTLLLHRVKKENDLNKDKWIGVGGGFEDKESPEDCLLREVYEETGLTLTRWRYRGIVTFVSDRWETEYMHLYTADGWTGDIIECNEGTLEWVNNARIPDLPAWAGDRIFLRLIAEDAPFFSLKLTYQGETLVSAELDGEPMQAPTRT